MSFLYDCALFVFALFTFPRMFFHMWLKGKYRSSFAAKLGFNFPLVNKQGRPLVWVHAVSVGETKAVVALVKRLKEAPEQPLVLVSSGTETGHEEAKRSMPFADFHVFLPFDFSWIIGPIIRKIKPQLVVLCETDWWYNFLNYAKQFGADVVVVNGKMSERSAKRFKALSFFSKHLFEIFDLICVQSKHYLPRFQELGISPEKLLVTGNIKFDQEYHRLSETKLREFREKMNLKEDHLTVVLGSTHAPEEQLLLSEISKVWSSYPELKVIIVPRHPERFDEVEKVIKDLNIPLQRYSKEQALDADARVILVDAMGLLRMCYEVATVAVVAGSFTAKVGGHNILEPMYAEVPTIFGPFMHSQPELLELTLNNQAGLQVKITELSQTIVDLLTNIQQRNAFIRSGTVLVRECRGATERTYEAIEQLLAKKMN